MKFKRRLKPSDVFNQVNNISFLNIVFLLFAFLAVADSFSVMPGMDVNFPAIIGTKEFGHSILNITLSDKNIIYINNKQVSGDSLKSIIVQKKYDSIFIKADKRASLEMLSDVWDICKKSGIEKISVATTYN